jgi:gluconolactonase
MRRLTLALAACLSATIAAQDFAQPPPARQVAVSAIPGVVAAGAQWTQAWAGRDNADGIVGTPDGAILFAQEQPRRVGKIDANNRLSIYLEGTNGAGSLGLDARGRLYAAQRTCTDPGLRLTSPCTEPPNISIIHPPNERKLLADNIQGKPLGRINDLVIDRSGGVYFTSGGAFHVSARGEVSAIGQNLRANGIMLSPDEKTLYVTNGPTIVAFDVGANGEAVSQRDFALLEAGGNGDGLAVDAAGRLYVTSAPGVQVFSPQGMYLGLIPTPRNAISVAFAGPQKRRLYVVGSGGVDADGREMLTEAGVRNNAKSIFWIPTIAAGFTGRAK